MILIDRGRMGGVDSGSMPKCRDVLVRFGHRVRELRTAQGYTQESFAAVFGLDRTCMGGIKRSERNVALRSIEKIAKPLSISIAELMRDIWCLQFAEVGPIDAA